MNGQTHFLGGVCAGAIAANFLPVDVAQTATGIAVAGIAGLAPDWLSINFPWVSIPGEGHRGVSHFLLFQCAAALAFYLLCPWLAPFILAGLASHSLLDMPTGEGILWLWPLPIRFRTPRRLRAHNGGCLESFAKVALICLALAVIASWII